jgi:hypothetical protein
MPSLEQIKHETKIFDDFRLKGEKVIKKLYDKYNEFGLEPKPISNNSFTFYFWGLKFKLKLEIEFDTVGRRFNYGEINTYQIIKKGDNKLLLSMSYDKLGNVTDNIMNHHSTLENDDFPEYYFVDFYNKLMDYINQEENNIKFQLI